MMHSLEAYSYLKLDPMNSIVFANQNMNKREIQVVQEYEKSKDGELQTDFMDIYKIKITLPTLRELLLFKSLYVTKTQSEILDLIKTQPTPEIFFKSMMEFEGSNIISVLSFESTALKYLLGKEFKKYFGPVYPLFYKNKYRRIGSEGTFYRNAIDGAIRLN
jgi:hypothetical protein